MRSDFDEETKIKCTHRVTTVPSKREETRNIPETEIKQAEAVKPQPELPLAEKQQSELSPRAPLRRPMRIIKKPIYFTDFST